LAFRHVGNASFFDKIKTIGSCSYMTLSENKFLQILQCLANRSNSLWVDPLIDVLKYEKEICGTKIKIIKATPTSYSIVLRVQTKTSARMVTIVQ
jgi:hypothetical protein